MATPTEHRHTGVRLLLITLNAIAILLSIVGARVVLFVALAFLVPFFLLNALIFFCQTQGIFLSCTASWINRGYSRIDTPTAPADEVDEEATTSAAEESGTADEDKQTDTWKLFVTFLDAVISFFCFIFHFVVGIISADGWGHSVMMGLDVSIIFMICA